MIALDIPGNTRWEFIIVDNGSTDHTASVIESFQKRLPIKRIIQNEPGLSQARNAGVAAATGAYMIWTDDDVLVEPSWLAAYRAAFERWPDAAVFGGKITPVLQPPTPAWFHEALPDLHLLLAARDFGSSPLPLSLKEDRLPFGANMAIRATEQKQCLYDTQLGVAPGRRRGGEETAVLKEILGKNNSGWWVPDAGVKHIIPSSRQTIDYLVHYYEAMGETDAYLKIRRGVSPLLSVPIEAGIKLPVVFARFYFARKFRTKLWVRYLARYAFHYGKSRYLLAALHGER